MSQRYLRSPRQFVIQHQRLTRIFSPAFNTLAYMHILMPLNLVTLCDWVICRLGEQWWAFQSSSRLVWDGNVGWNNWDWILIRRLCTALRHLDIITSTLVRSPSERGWWSDDSGCNSTVQGAICLDAADTQTDSQRAVMIRLHSGADPAAS